MLNTKALIDRASRWLSMIGDIESYSVRCKGGMIRLAFYLYRKVPENFVTWDFTVQQFAEFSHDDFNRHIMKFITPICKKELEYRNWPQVLENWMKEGGVQDANDNA